jgi:hypothetical protein
MNGCVAMLVFHHCEKIPEKSKLKEKIFILAHHGWLAPLLLGMWHGRRKWQKCMEEESCSLHGGQKAKRQAGARVKTHPSKIYSW